MTDDARAELERLLSALCDGPVAEEQRLRLNELLRSSPEARQCYMEFIGLHTALMYQQSPTSKRFRSPVESASDGSLGCDDCGDEAPPAPLRAPAGSRVRRRRRWLYAATALAIAGVALAWWRADRGAAGSEGPIVARVTSVGGAQFDCLPGGPPAVGDPIRTGGYNLTAGLAEITFLSDARVVLEAPCRFEIGSPDLLVLHRGRLTATVPAEAIGFVVETPSATVVDFGTEFGVEVDELENGEIHVFLGEVEVRPKSALSNEPVRLVANEASRVDRATATPAGIDLDAGRFLRQLDEPKTRYEDLVHDLNPVLYLPMGVSPDGTCLMDATGNGHDGRIHRAQRPHPPWAVGRVGCAIALGGPGRDEYVVIPDYSKTKTGSLSVTAWVLADSRGRWAGIAKNWAAGKQRGQFSFGLHKDDGGLEAHVVDMEGNVIFARELQPLSLGQWHHVAFVADGQSLRLYRDGQEVAAVPCGKVGPDPACRALSIGSRLDRSGERPDRMIGCWHGRIDELAVFNHALTPEQIQRLYNAVQPLAGGASTQ